MNNMISVNNISELRNLTPVTDDQIVFLVSHTPDISPAAANSIMRKRIQPVRTITVPWWLQREEPAGNDWIRN